MNTTITTETENKKTHSEVLRDGVTHINIDGAGITELGQRLDFLYRSRFIHPVFGPFNSIEAFWGYIRSGATDDSMRYLYGMNAKRHSKKVSAQFIKNFQEIIREANFLKIEQNDELRQLMINSTLPFKHYYIFRNSNLDKDFEGLLIHPQIASWLTKGFEEIRAMLKVGARPNPVDYSGVHFIAS